VLSGWTTVWNTLRSNHSNAWSAIFNTARDRVGALRDAVVNAVSRIQQVWTSAWNGIKGVATSVWGTITNGVRNGVNTVIRLINGITGGINVVLRFLKLPEIGKIGEIGAQASGSIRPGFLPTYHEGGVVGKGGRATGGPLKPDEQLIKALKGEEVLTEKDPRHVANMGVPDTDWVLPIGGPWDTIRAGANWVRDRAGDILNGVRNLIARTARPIIEAALRGVDGATRPFGRFGEMGAQAVRHVAVSALGWLGAKEREAKDEDEARQAWYRAAASQAPPGAGTIGNRAVGMGFQRLLDIVRKAGAPHVVTSTMRPGDRGYHGRGKAADFSIGGHGNAGYRHSGLRRIFDAFLPYGASLAELILAGAPFNIKNGKRVGGYAWGRPGSPGNHWNHVHAATFDQGGTLKPGWNTVLNATGGPETLRPEGWQDDEPIVERLEELIELIRLLPSEYKFAQRTERVR
jgi:hypothetical protein